MGKNVAVFVDVANIFYAAKAAGVDIDYVTLLKSATAGRDLVRAYAYTGLDPDNENQRNFHDFLRRSNYKVVSKDIRKYGDGKVKANLDIELVVDMMKTARNLDIAIVVSGDGDFAPAIRAVQEQGVRVEVISFRGNTSSDLIEVADQFTDIVQLARVEKGSRSGRRVADDEADLSMTEVPDKQTEGTGVGRGGRGRGRGRVREEEPVAVGRVVAVAGPAVAATAGAASRSRRCRSGGAAGRAPRARRWRADRGGTGGRRGVHPGRSRPDDGERAPAMRPARPRVGSRTANRDAGGVAAVVDAGVGVAGRTRPRRAQPRGSSRAVPGASGCRAATSSTRMRRSFLARRAPRTTPFGSVWDSQLGNAVSARCRVAGADRRRRGLRRAGDPRVPDRRAAARGEPGRCGGRGGPAAAAPPISRPWSASASGAVGAVAAVAAGPAAAVTASTATRTSAAGLVPWDPGVTIAATAAQSVRSVPPPPRNSSEPWSDVPPELEACSGRRSPRSRRR